MVCRDAIGGFLLTTAVTLMMATSGTRADDAARYPDWKGAWVRLDDVSGGSFDPSKRPGRAQQPPLTSEYQAVWEANMAERARGGQYYNTQVRCLPGGMPRMMIAYQPLEAIITPGVTHIHIEFFNEHRRIYLRDEITTFDHALTRPWTVTRGYQRDPDPVWIEDHCEENNQYVFIRGESFLKSADGSLMPTRKDQPPPDLKFFNQPER